MKHTIEVIRNFLKKMSKDHVSAYSSQAAYFVLVSFFPFLLLLMTLIPYTPVDRSEVSSMILKIVPDSFRSLVLSIINEVYGKSLAIVPISAVTALWSAGKGVQALTNGLNCIYEVDETRNFLMTRLRSIIYTVIFIAAILATLLFLVFGNSIQMRLAHYFPWLVEMLEMIISLRTAITLTLLTVVFLLLYKFIPNRKASLKSQLPGAAFTSIAWSLFSFGFSLYIDLSSGMRNMYGSMTSILLALLWMYICMYIVMLGAEINCYFEDRFREVHQAARDRIAREYQQLLCIGETEDGEEEEEKLS